VVNLVARHYKAISHLQSLLERYDIVCAQDVRAPSDNYLTTLQQIFTPHIDIAAFCEKNYGVSFPLFDKVDVNGANAHPLFTLLKAEAPGVLGTEGIKWNFTNFLVGRDGKVHERYAPTTTPAQLESDVAKLLAA
jgi:glutathione peroxidase-family protein